MKKLFLIEFDDVDYTSQQMQEFLSKIPHSKVTELTVPDDVREGLIEVIKKVHVLFYPKLFLGQDDLFKTTADALIAAGYVREKSKAMTFEEFCNSNLFVHSDIPKNILKEYYDWYVLGSNQQ